MTSIHEWIILTKYGKPRVLLGSVLKYNMSITSHCIIVLSCLTFGRL